MSCAGQEIGRDVRCHLSVGAILHLPGKRTVQLCLETKHT